MRVLARCLVTALAALSPLAASAQAEDAAYCKALTRKYETYVSDMSRGGSPIPGTVDGKAAIEQCRLGNTSVGIPVLEQKLRNARVELPPRAGDAPAATKTHLSDADYCTALSQKYEDIVAPMRGASPIPGSVDGRVAVEQCKAGNTAAAIPVLEEKLNNARVDLPPRG